MHLRHLNSLSPPPFETLNKKPRDTHSSSNINPSFLIVAIILFLVFIISAALHFLLRYLNHHHHQHHQNQEEEEQTATIQEPAVTSRISNRRVAPETNHETLIKSLPIFSYNRLRSNTSTSTRSSADCAVCLSKFEPHDQLRLLPLCCHAFHLTCIDTWLQSNHTCPLCRSTIHLQESDQYKKLFQETNNNNNTSFRVQMGNVSSTRSESDRRRSYSIGSSFEYLLDDDDVVVLENNNNNNNKKEEAEAEVTIIPVGPGDDVAGEVGRGWLKEYVDRLASSVSSNNSSSSISISNSFRFFTGSSRRSTADGFTGSSRRRSAADVVNNGGSWDLEGNAYGEEIGNFLRWLSGV